MKRISWDDFFLGIVEAVSKRGDCSRRQVGALVIDSVFNRIISTGYNGMPPGEPGCFEIPCDRVHKARRGETVCLGYSDCRSIHAEENAIIRASGQELCGSILYSTEWPCTNCWKLIKGSGIYRVVTRDREWVAWEE